MYGVEAGEVGLEELSESEGEGETEGEGEGSDDAREAFRFNFLR